MTSRKGRIICIDDDQDTRDLLTFILTDAGYKVACTDDPDIAIGFAKSEYFDLFVVDNWMPGMSGIELTKKLRQFGIKTPVLFYSGAGMETDKEDAELAGAQAYLVKPAVSEDLIAQVGRLIEEGKIGKPLKVVLP